MDSNNNQDNNSLQNNNSSQNDNSCQDGNYNQDDPSNQDNGPDQNNNTYQKGIEYQNGNPYQNGNEYQNGNPYQNGNSYPNNNPYQNGNSYQDGNPYQNNRFYISPNAAPSNSFALAAMVMGILTIVFACIFPVYLPQIFAALAIIFALLSKGSNVSMHNNAKAGITTAVIGFVISIIVIISSFYLVLTNPEYRAKANAICEEMYGQSLDDLLDDSYGVDIPNL